MRNPLTSTPLVTKDSSMRLIDLNPRWVGQGENLRHIGVSFLCPHCLTKRLSVYFQNPPDGGMTYELVNVPDGPPEARKLALQRNNRWTLSGTNFENMTLSPSIDVSEAGHWHGFIKNGNIE